MEYETCRNFRTKDIFYLAVHQCTAPNSFEVFQCFDLTRRQPRMADDRFWWRLDEYYRGQRCCATCYHRERIWMRNSFRPWTARRHRDRTTWWPVGDGFEIKNSFLGGFSWVYLFVVDLDRQRRRPRWRLSCAKKNATQLWRFKLHFDLQMFSDDKLFLCGEKIFALLWVFSWHRCNRVLTYCIQRMHRPRSMNPSPLAGNIVPHYCSASSGPGWLCWHWSAWCSL